MNMSKKQKQKRKTIWMKLFISIIYLAIIGVLSVASYYFYKQKQIILPWKQSIEIEDYTYLDIVKMSEKFAYYEETNVGLHFITDEKEISNYVYVIAINENEYETYKAIIDYTYERTEKVPDKIRVYGYPTKIDENIKSSAIKNISNFIPAEKKTTEEETYESYLPEKYLDTTKEQQEKFSIPLCISLLLTVTVFIVLLLTIFDRKDNKEEKGEDKDA